MKENRTALKTLLCAALISSAPLAWAQDLVAYHINDAKASALAALRNIRNHLDTDPSAKITVVAHGAGVDFLLEGAKDGQGSPYAGPVSALAARGVKFEICEITLRTRNMKREEFIQEASFTPSGVVRLAKLQRAGHVYIKP